MGVDTHLYVSHRFSIEDICDVLKCHLNVKNLKVHSHTEVNPQMFTIGFEHEKEKLSMYAHTDFNLPTGPTIRLSVGYNEQTVRIMKGIANVIGGILEKMDSIGTMESIEGALSDEDGLAYFLKWATIHNKIPEGSIKELNAAMHEWFDEVKSTNREKYELFPLEG